MKNFAKRGFQLRSSRIETRIAYTGFTLLMLPAIGTFLALSLGRIGFTPARISVHYRGGESEMSFPKTFWQLVEVSHFHLFSMPIVALVVTHLLCATPAPTRLRVWLTSLVYVGVCLDAAGPWAVRYLSPVCAYALLAGWLALAGSLLAIAGLSLFSMWAPDGWVDRLAPESDTDNGRPS